LINVVQPSLPNFGKYVQLLSDVYASNVITNSGPLHNRLEQELALRFDVPYVSLMANATVALESCIRALSKRKQVVTSPFSFIASSTSIVNSGFDPVFVDIQTDSFCMSPVALDTVRWDDVGLILPIHCYGMPCSLDAIQDVANRRSLPLLYDAAHCFDVFVGGQSILKYGDASVVSFHGTKVFHTVEGGAVFTKHKWLKCHLDAVKNFGFGSDTDIIGSNYKMSEVHAAMGLVCLDEVENWIEIRKRVTEIYDEEFRVYDGLSTLCDHVDVQRNYAYYPVVIKHACEGVMQQIVEIMMSDGIGCRRYFYPALHNFGCFNQYRQYDCPVAVDTASKVLCLPLHSNMSEGNATEVCDKFLRICKLVGVL
jgi:dTDP-4-amino-4,6-dideoxygalactose transaminase